MEKLARKIPFRKQKALTVLNDSTGFNKQIYITPNPANNFISVKFNLYQSQPARVTVIKSAGMSMYTDLIGTVNTSGTHNIDTKNWESGVFMFAIDHGVALLYLQKVAVAY